VNADNPDDGKPKQVSPIGAVLRIAFRDGCGLVWEEVKKHPRYLELLKLEESKAESSDELGRELVRCGPHLTSIAITGMLDDAEVLEYLRSRGGEANSYADDRALLRFLGEELIRAADASLNSELLRIAERYKNAKTDKQRAKAVIRILTAMESKGRSGLADIAQQSEASVLPLKFGKFGKRCVANCVGKAIILAAWGRRLGLQGVGVSGFESAGTLKNRSMRRLYRKLVKDVETSGMFVNNELKTGINNSLETAIRSANGLRMNHLAPGFEVPDDKILVIDPHKSTAFCYEVNDAFRQLKRYHEFCPGLTLDVFAMSVKCEMQAAARKAGRTLKILRRLRMRYTNSSGTVEDFLEAVVETGALKVLMDAWPPVRAIQRQMKKQPATEQARIFLSDRLRRYNRKFTPTYVSTAENTAEPREFIGVLNQLLFTIVTQFEAEIRRLGTTGQSFASAEISHQEYGIAIAVLSHIATLQGFAAEMENALYSHSSGYFRWAFHAGSLLREGESTTFAEHGIAMLNIGRARKRVAQRLLRKIARHQARKEGEKQNAEKSRDGDREADAASRQYRQPSVCGEPSACCRRSTTHCSGNATSERCRR